ncbi:M20/M25/M40 family metallo-hydrolase [Paraburkholderia sp. J63]|uniref:M20/M25/M40 family metallo-hydrolase n=1 Tax=Paraburkholderia sp. J63 TaxID=2805434 RepID=UPI002ABE6078|nr:M20/M25/M40 family metallo-hydrolase [Paraburkholderia sp. J63]
MNSTITAAISQFLDQHAGEQIDFLRALVRTPADNPPGDCAPHAQVTARLLEQLGFQVERHPVPPALCADHSMRSATNLIARTVFGQGPVIALSAHGDAVRPGDGWTFDPYGGEIADGYLYGRGAAVSKSDIATYAYAILALKALSPMPGGTLELHVTYDEEAGGYIGPRRLLDEGLTRPDYAICPGFSYDVVTGHDGVLHLEVSVAGKSAHAAWPETGFDALEAATRVLEALYQHRKGYRNIRSGVPGIESPTLVVGLIQGGINTNVVPDKVTFRLDRRMIPEERPDEVEAALREVIDGAVKACPGITVEVARLIVAHPLVPSEASIQMADVLKRHASEVFGTSVGTCGVPLYTDARHYASAGVPTILYGTGPKDPLDANVHRANERIRVSDLRQATEVVARFVYDWLSGVRA